MHPSLREIRVETLRRVLIDVVQHQYLGIGTVEFAVSERAEWRRLCTVGPVLDAVEARRRCVAATASEISAELRRLKESSDEDYDAATADLPLSYWDLTPSEIGPYARARGIEARETYERFAGFGEHVMDGSPGPGMSGYSWFRCGSEQRLTRADLLQILGSLVYDQATARCAAKYAATARTKRAVNSGGAL